MYVQKNNPIKKRSKVKGGGTKKVCLPAAKVRSMSKAERDRVVRAKRKAAKSGGYKRSSKSNVKGARKKVLHYAIGFKKKIGYKLVTQVKNVEKNNICIRIK